MRGGSGLLAGSWGEKNECDDSRGGDIRGPTRVMAEGAGFTVIRTVGVQGRVRRDREERDQSQCEAQALQNPLQGRMRSALLGAGAIEWP